MKFFLIFVAINATNPNEALLGHKIYDSEVACLSAAAKLPKNPPGALTATFCVPATDMLEVKRNSL